MNRIPNFPQLATAAAMALALQAPLWADIRYDQTTRMTGGAMMSMMKMAGRLGGQNITEPITSTISIKGNQQFTKTKDTLQIIDLDKETMTDVNFKNESYSVITFAQMKEALAKMGGKKKDSDADVQMEIKADETGKKATVEGKELEEVLFSVVSTISDDKKKDAAEFRMEMSVWYNNHKPAGYAEVEAFQKRFAEKFGSMPNMGLAGMMKGSAKQMAEVGRKMGERGGIAAITVMRMVPADPEKAAEMEKQAEAQRNAPPAPSANEAAAAAISEKLGRLGGLGGFGRKKQQAEAGAAKASEAKPKSEDKPNEAAKLPVEPSFSSGASMMDFLTETHNFSQTTVHAEEFAIPANFKQVESPMAKAVR